MASILWAWVSECVFDSESRYLRCPIKFRYPLGGLINMTKKCHFVKFMVRHIWFVGFGLVWFSARLQSCRWPKIIFTMPFDWSSNRYIFQAVQQDATPTTTKEMPRDSARTISLSLKQLILLFRWHLASTGLSTWIRRGQNQAGPTTRRLGPAVAASQVAYLVPRPLGYPIVCFSVRTHMFVGTVFDINLNCVTDLFFRNSAVDYAFC